MSKRQNGQKIFDWQTDNEAGWRSESVGEGEETAVSSHFYSYRRIYWGVLITFLLLLIGAAITINRRVENGTSAVADELINTHQLLMQAAIDQDRELFSSFIQPENRLLSQNQETLLTRNLFLNRAPLGLWFDYEAAESPDWAEISQVTLSPDLTEAELSVDLPYLYRDEAEEVQSVTLRQTAVYQQDVNGRWQLQLTPPASQFWGEYEFEEHPYLKLVFPERDAEVGRRLAADISSLLVQLCNSDEIICPDDLVIELYLSRNIEKLADLNRDYQWDSNLSSLIKHTILLDVPAPSLVGMPVDDDGYSALQRGYASLLAATMIHQFGADNDNRLPDQIRIQQQLAAYQLALPSSLNTHPQQVSEQPPIPFPDQDIILMCRNQFENVLYQYQIRENQWQTIPLLGGDVSGMSALSNGDGALLTLENLNGDGGSQLIWLQGVQARILAEDVLTTFSSFMMPQLDETDPLQHVIRYGTRTRNGFERHIGLLDEASCTDEACALLPLEQVPIFSPNGRFQLLSTFASELILADTDGELIQSLGEGVSPQWHDEQTFTFVEVEEQAGGVGIGKTTLITAVINENGVTQNRTTIDDLLPVLPVGVDTEGLFIFGSFSVVEDQQLIPIYSIDGQLSLQYVIQTDAQFESAKLLQDFTDMETATILGQGPSSLAPRRNEGRFLTFAVNESGEPNDTTLRLYDIKQDSWQIFPMSFVWEGSVTWSTDGNWLLLLEKDALRFVLPGHDYDRRIFHDFQNCVTAVWVNQP